MKKIFFEWENDLLTGIDIIDEQHHSLINMINTMLQLCFDKEEIRLNTITEIHQELTSYINEHFETEETIMKTYHIDPRHMEEHMFLHREFKTEIEVSFSDSNKLLSRDKLGELTEFLIRWLAYHILNMDKSLVRQISMIEKEALTPEMAYLKEDRYIEASTEPLLRALRALFLIVTEKNKELIRANAELEEKVHQRMAELTLANQKLKDLSMIDELTGLNNRRYAIASIDELFNNWERYKATFSLLFIDVDKFKEVNDNFGHEYGDTVLKWISTFLKEHVRKTDIVCRLGGDEFLIISEHCDQKSAFNLAQKLCNICGNFNLETLKECWIPSLSIGVAEIGASCKSTNDILKKADGAMYKAKKNGGGQAVTADI